MPDNVNDVASSPQKPTTASTNGDMAHDMAQTTKNGNMQEVRNEGREVKQQVRTTSACTNDPTSTPTPTLINPGALPKPTTTPNTGDMAPRATQTTVKMKVRVVKTGEQGDMN